MFKSEVLVYKALKQEFCNEELKNPGTKHVLFKSTCIKKKKKNKHGKFYAITQDLNPGPTACRTSIILTRQPKCVLSI